MISRRQVLRGIAAMGLSTAGLGGYAVAEPWRLNVTRYRLASPKWAAGPNLKIAILADLHACDPWMSLARVRQIVARTNALSPDIVLMLGDFIAGHRMMKRTIPNADWAAALAELSAPLGRHAILGNHDWWEEWEVQRRRKGPTKVRHALEKAGIPVYENTAIRLVKDGKPFWLAGLGEQWAFFANRDRRLRPDNHGYEGVDDLPGTIAQLGDNAPALMMIHEPDAFARMPDRVALTFAGHTHGGQVTFAGYAPVVPSRYGARYRYGHIVENNRDLIVSGGLGCSGLPLRFGVPPEIVMVELSA